MACDCSKRETKSNTVGGTFVSHSRMAGVPHPVVTDLTGNLAMRDAMKPLYCTAWPEHRGSGE